LSTASFVECSMILESRYGADGVRDLDLFIAKAQVSLVPVDEEQADFARRAFRNYGKGHHPASLNFSDCFSYALARALDEPLLFKGNDFPQTDVKHHPATSPHCNNIAPDSNCRLFSSTRLTPPQFLARPDRHPCRSSKQPKHRRATPVERAV